MSVVAPSRNIPSPLRIPKWGQKKSKTVDFPFEEPPATPLSPTIPNKSPKRQNFFPSPISASEEKKYTLKTLPSTPTKPHSQTSSYPPLPSASIARSNTRLSNVSTAVGSASSGTASPSPSSNITAPFPPPAAHPASSPLKRVPTTSTSTSTPIHTRARSQSTTTQPRRPQADICPPAPLPTPSTRQKLSDQSSSTSLDKTQGTKPPPTTGQRLREGAFFAFVLLPLSCWYTRGGKRLKELDMREVEEGRDARARAKTLVEERERARESLDEMRMPPRAAVGGKIGRRMSFDSAPVGNVGHMQKKLSSDDLGMKRVKTYTSEPVQVGRAQTPDFRRQRSRFDVQRRSFDEGVVGRRRADSWGAETGNGNGHARSRSLRQHPDFDFEVERVPLVRRTTTASAIIRELTPGRAI